MQRTVLVISPHADDITSFCGGQSIKFVDEGWRVVLVRVTNDETDSIGLSREETIRVNTEQMHAAARIMGIRDIVELGYVTDCLGDVSRVQLREKFIRLFRQYRPYAVLSFDPYAQYEPNLDHVVTAQAVEEAYWTAAFDKHHPEHFAEGLEPFSVCEHWYFARQLLAINAAVDISAQIERNIEALSAQSVMWSNGALNLLRMQLKTWGRRVALLDEAIDSGNIRPVVEHYLYTKGRRWGQKYGMEYAEVYRVDRFGSNEEFFQRESVPLPGMEDVSMQNWPWFETKEMRNE